MDKPDLLAALKSELEKLDQYQSFIDKARNMSGKFNPAVVEKVIRDNTERITEVHAVVEPLIPQVREVVQSLEADKVAVESGVEDAKLMLEELELRLAIGELDESEVEQQAGEVREQVEGADARIAEIEQELSSFKEALEAWSDKAPSEDLTITPAAEEEEDLLGALEDDDDGLLGGFDGGDDAFEGADGRGSNVHAERVSISDDVSSVFDDDEPVPAAGEEADSIDDALVDLDEGDASDETAVLVLDEGTPGEQVFAFEGEVISLGRNRDNTVQVKNDSKVSRYHCKVYKRDGYYFIEDNKSANGTLVDGQLVTDKRLLGGEEIIVGETMFRFRIHG